MESGESIYNQDDATGFIKLNPESFRGGRPAAAREGDGGKAGEAVGIGIGCWLCRRRGREGSAQDPATGVGGRCLSQFRDSLGKHLKDEILAS